MDACSRDFRSNAWTDFVDLYNKGKIQNIISKHKAYLLKYNRLASRAGKVQTTSFGK